MNTKTLAQRSAEICDIAGEAAGDGPGWNKRFEFEITSRGWTIHPINAGSYLGTDAPIVAPIPVEGADAYPYPSVIVPKHWKLPE